MAASQEHELLVLGDLHGHFDETDIRFIERRAPLLTLFVGDLGDEDVEIVERISELQVPHLVMLGNHDAWRSFREKKATPALNEILEKLGDRHLAYERHELPELDMTLIGGRPFSWGGQSLRSPELYKELYGIQNHEESAERIVEIAEEAETRRIILLAHNGPLGLGDRPGSILGKDFGKPGGDWGDLDLQIALRRLDQLGFEVPLVIFGHMHHRLIFPRGSTRERSVQRDGTVFFNSARVPRIWKPRDAHVGEVRHYASLTFKQSRLERIRDLYASEVGMRGRTFYDRERSQARKEPRSRGAQH
jgi:uncharacterized protein (TIGR04168 family)